MTDSTILERLRGELDATRGRPRPADLLRAVSAESSSLTTATATVTAVASLYADLVGFGRLEPLIRDPEVTDVLVNGPTEVWVDRGNHLQRSEITFPDADDLRALAVRLAATVGRRLDDASPCVDVCLPDRTRIHAVLPPICPQGPLLSIRIPRARPFDPDALVASAMLCTETLAWLRTIVLQRRPFLVCGGTGSGKTTLLSTLLGLVPEHERILLVEDDAELMPMHPHVVRLESRRVNVEGTGAIGMRDLVRESLRMRPDRIVVGEVRGAEVIDLMTAMNTGHRGGCATLHANAISAVPQRLSALGWLAGMPPEATYELAGQAFDAVVGLSRDATGRRFVEQLGALGRDSLGALRVESVWSSDGRTLSPGPAYDRVAGAWEVDGVEELRIAR